MSGGLGRSVCVCAFFCVFEREGEETDHYRLYYTDKLSEYVYVLHHHFICAYNHKGLSPEKGISVCFAFIVECVCVGSGRLKLSVYDGIY